MDFDLSSRGATAHVKSVAVVLSTYNGSRYVRKQLDSLLSQRKLPDSIVISDDCSTDETPKIVRDFIAEHQDSPVSFEFSVNDKNIGWKANFRRLISHCEATYIFPCDQDDIWNPNKIESMVEVMESNPDFDLLACSVEPFYEEGSRKSDAGSVEAALGADRLERDQLRPDFMYVRHPGCSYCVRGAFVKRVLPYWESTYPHDAVLWRYAVLEDGAAVLNQRLVRFRRHDGNASDRKKQTKADRLADVDYYIDFVEHAKRFVEADERCGSESLSLLLSCEEWLDARKRLLEVGSIGAAVACLRNRRFYKTTRGPLLDIAFAWLEGLSV